MKLRFFLHIAGLFFTSINTFAQPTDFRTYNYSDIGLQFTIPSNWTEDGLATTTKAAFIKQFGWIYDKPDAQDVWSAVGSFSSLEVDSTLIPSDSAYTLHRLTIFVSRANTLYKQWLCKYRRNSLWQAKPLVKEGDTLIRDDGFWPYELPEGLSTAKGQSYEFIPSQAKVPTLGHVFSFIHESRCFELKLESTATNMLLTKSLHAYILKSVSLTPF